MRVRITLLESPSSRSTRDLFEISSAIHRQMKMLLLWLAVGDLFQTRWRGGELGLVPMKRNNDSPVH